MTQFKIVLRKLISSEKTDLMMLRNSTVMIAGRAIPPCEPSSPKPRSASYLIVPGALLGIVGLALLRGKRARVSAAALA